MAKFPGSALEDPLQDMDPPAYEEIVSGDGKNTGGAWDDSKIPQRFCIREEIGASRSQHVAALTAKLLPQIKERARRGLSRFSLLILPSNQADFSNQGELVGWPEDDRPVLIQLEGECDNSQFWTQQEALNLLQQQMLTELSGGLPQRTVEEPLPERPAPRPKSWFGGRKQSKSPVAPPTAKPKPPVTVETAFEMANFRRETEYGLYETIRRRAVLLTVHVK